MSIAVEVVTSTVTTKKGRIELTQDTIVELLREAGHIPEHATSVSATVEVPRGMGGMEMTIDRDTPVVVRWTRTVESSDE